LSEETGHRQSCDAHPAMLLCPLVSRRREADRSPGQSPPPSFAATDPVRARLSFYIFCRVVFWQRSAFVADTRGAAASPAKTNCSL
jgi:hypothetical protein